MNTRNIHEIVTAFKGLNELRKPFKIGSALEVDEGVYSIKLHAYPRTFFYLVSDGEGSYKLYSKKIFVDGMPKYEQYLGFGKIMHDLKTHLQIKMIWPRCEMYMALFPTA